MKASVHNWVSINYCLTMFKRTIVVYSLSLRRCKLVMNDIFMLLGKPNKIIDLNKVAARLLCSMSQKLRSNKERELKCKVEVTKELHGIVKFTAIKTFVSFCIT